ncbi:MAG TPA: MMPL family transporter [Marmoricola sp.]|nr:MMPL family transporter [Marmoricola sp.]
MRTWAEFVLRHRLWVAIFWVVIAVAGIAVSKTTTDRMTIDFSLPGQPGTDAANKIIADFHNGGDTAPLLISVTMPKGQTVTGNEAAIGKAFDDTVAKVASTKTMRLVDEANTGDKAFRTSDDRTAYAMVFYPFPTSATEKPPVDLLRNALDSVKPAGSTVGVTGEDALAVGDDDTGNSVLVETVLGAVGALLVLAFVFASFLALLPLIIALVSIMTTFLLLLPLTYATDVSFIVQFLVALIGLGVAIDYSLILVNRWREERDHGKDNHEAVAIAVETAGHAVLFSGITVAIGLVALVVLPVPFMRSIGYGGALIPVASVAVTLSLTPVILSSIGPWLDRPKIRHEDKASKGWIAWARAIVQRRWVAAGAAFVILGLLFVAFTGIKIGVASSDSLAKNGKAYDALHVLKAGGITTGALTPIEVLAEKDKAPAVAEELGKVKGISHALVSTGPTSNTDTHTVVVLIPDKETVNSKSVGVVRDVVEASKGIDGVIGVTGLGTAQVDFLHAVYGNFPLMLALIALLTFVLLVRAFRSLLLPLKAVLLNLISLSAVYGAMVLFWQDGHGSEALFGIAATGAVTFWVPLMVFAFLFGLSMDYEVFILARIREEYDNGRTTNEAVIEGIGRTGRLVTSAALILFLAFAALASGPGTDLKVMATALGFGILLDATVVRSLLVPSLVSLFGSWNWYLPDWVARVLRIEISHPHSEDPEPEPEPELVGAP